MVANSSYTLKSQRMQTQRYLNTQEYGTAIGNAYIRPQVSGASVRRVTAAIMEGYYDLSKYERGVIVGAREMVHSISELARPFHEYTVIIRNPVKHQISDIPATGKNPERKGPTTTEDNRST